MNFFWLIALLGSLVGGLIMGCDSFVLEWCPARSSRSRHCCWIRSHSVLLCPMLAIMETLNKRI